MRAPNTTNPGAPLSLAGLILTGTALLFLFFLILSGVRNSTPLNKTYFLQADTNGISGARDVTRWTYFYMCGQENAHCGKARPAPAFGKAWDSNAAGVPSNLMGSHGGDTTSGYYFYMWRFGWVFFLIALFFTTLAFFASFLACCGRIGSLLLGLFSSSAIARNAFRHNGRRANIGTYAFSWAWAGWAALLLASLLFCCGIRKKESSSRKHRRGIDDGVGYTGNTYNNTTYNNTAYDDSAVPAAAVAPRTRRFWNRGNRGYDARRVKDEYN
ncbi:hypothetical protein jhhlp_004230 [Lomentospora prolificans]|uniref:Uncharacterized protein n=1 Tax=Lomentospora prolificans TaxID=41688 RepID=A0A2N3NB49_9PEZI|nr:hypothetical protein jhhlp_004230 [Lomentospora prolificans]